MIGPLHLHHPMPAKLTPQMGCTRDYRPHLLHQRSRRDPLETLSSSPKQASIRLPVGRAPHARAVPCPLLPETILSFCRSKKTSPECGRRACGRRMASSIKLHPPRALLAILFHNLSKYLFLPSFSSNTLECLQSTSPLIICKD